MRPVQTNKSIVEFFRKNDHVAKIGLRDQRNALHFFKIPGMRQNNPHAVAGIGAIVFYIFMLGLNPTNIPDTALTNTALFVSIVGLIAMVLGYGKALRNMNWKLFE